MPRGFIRARAHDEGDKAMQTLEEKAPYLRVNLSILVSNKCKTLINVCAMVQSVSL